MLKQLLGVMDRLGGDHRWRWFLFALLGALCLVPSASADTPPMAYDPPPPDVTYIDIRDRVKQADVKRLGINIGAPDQYGAAQYLKNLVTNPGFEAGEAGMIFNALTGAFGNRVQADNWWTYWNNPNVGQPVGFWEGAEYEIVFGAAKGRTGNIANFTHQDDRYTFYLNNQGTPPQSEDVVFVRQEVAGFEGDRGEFNRADTTQTRPGSPGKQSLQLLPPFASWQTSYVYHMDSFWRDGDAEAGKLYVVQGNYHFEIWAKGERNGDTLEIFFHREGEQAFFSEVVPLTTNWQKIERDFLVPSGADPFEFGAGVNYITDVRQGTMESDVTRAIDPDSTPILELGFRLKPSSGRVWVDDVWLGRAGQRNPTVFTDRFVFLLKALRPGILRDWGKQLGSSLDNQLAVPWARKPTAHSPRDRWATDFQYSLPEFLALAQEVGAEPWYVIPPTFTVDEMGNLMAYLAAPAGAHPYADLRARLGQVEPWTTVFPTIHLEYGNEMWGGNSGNDPFVGGTVRNGIQLGEITQDRLGALRRSPFFVADGFNLVIGGQAGAVERQGQIEAYSNAHDSVALAPYFGFLDDDYGAFEDIYLPAFSRMREDVVAGVLSNNQHLLDASGQGTELSIYEIGFHTTTGDAPTNLRNDFVTGLNGGVALPLYMLTYMRDLGIRNQNAFTAAQFSYQMDNGEYVRLWGMLRDLEATGLKRPTWLGLELANRAIQGDMLEVVQSGNNPTWIQWPKNDVSVALESQYIHSFAFREGNNYSLILFNTHLTESVPLFLLFPRLPSRDGVLHMLSGTAINADNETGLQVTIRSQRISDLEQGYGVEMPAFSMYVLEWESPEAYLPFVGR